MKQQDPNNPVGKNFKLWEFTTSQTASRKGIDNTPPQNAIVKIKALCKNVLDPLREACGPIRISSGYRSPALNKAVGGSSSSQHMVGEAADLIPLQISKAQLYNYIVKNLDYDQIIWEFGNDREPDWVHVSYVTHRKNRKQQLRIR